MWVHVNLWFQFEEQSEIDNVRVRNFLYRLVRAAKPHLQQYFYLYEPDPHCFLALRVEENQVFIVLEKLRKCWTPQFVRRVSYTFPTMDGTNNPDSLDAMSAVAKGIVEGRLAVQKRDRGKGCTEFHHLIHCLMDMYYGSRDEERACYQQMLKWYSPLPAHQRRQRK